MTPELEREAVNLLRVLLILWGGTLNMEAYAPREWERHVQKVREWLAKYEKQETPK